MRGIKKFVISVSVVAVALAALATVVVAGGLKPRLGLDLRGGLSVILTAPEGTRQDILDKTVEVLRNRVDAAGVAEPEISREGSTNILIQIPGSGDPQRLLALIGRTAQLQFRQVTEEIRFGDERFQTTELTKEDDPGKEVTLAASSSSKLKLTPVELTGEAVRDARAVIDQQNGTWTVSLRFKRDGAKKWEEFTGRLACQTGPARQIAIVLDGKVESHPEVAQEVQCNKGITGGTTQISGSFTEKEAKDLALVLTTGALPVELEQSEVRTVSPTLGKESLRAGIVAGIIGLALVMLYVLIYYRTLGLQTWVGLMVFAGFIYGFVVILGALIGWSLTLAGIAGLIVSIGIATDSYIVFFERVKEEVHEGRTLRTSMDRGFAGAWKTLRTANAVTIMAALILYLLAVGPVRGFALALGMATTLDLIIFAALTWPLAALLARNKFFAEGRFIGMRRALEGGKSRVARKIYRSEFNVDFIGRRRIWLGLSGIIVAVAAVALVPSVRGLTFGIDFRGGTVLRAPLAGEVTTRQVQKAMADAGQKTAVAQILRDTATGARRVQVQTEAIPDPEKRRVAVETLAAQAGVEANKVDIEAVGEKWGQQITTKALRGLVIFLVLVILYMSWRLDLKMALAGIAALLHDLVVTAGIYALVGFEVSPATVIAILTILGYSLYDTVVVFDKIRENVALPSNARRSFADIANQSSNQVLMRSINTSLSTLLPVGSLLFVGSLLLGADTLKDLALALFIGIAAGTYSSVFVATPLLSIWKEREPRYASIKQKVLAGSGSGAVRRGSEAVDDDRDGAARGEAGPADEASPEAEEVKVGAASAQRPAGRNQQRRQPRSKRKRARR